MSEALLREQLGRIEISILRGQLYLAREHILSLLLWTEPAELDGETQTAEDVIKEASTFVLELEDHTK